MGKNACLILCLRMRKDFHDAGLIINVPKCQLDPAFCLRQLGFDIDMGEGKFRVPSDRWEALHFATDALLIARGERVNARELASLTGTVISMKLVWGPVTQPSTRHMYALINYMLSLNYSVVLSKEA